MEEVATFAAFRFLRSTIGMLHAQYSGAVVIDSLVLHRRRSIKRFYGDTKEQDKT
jgi:hypothetical protein